MADKNKMKLKYDSNPEEARRKARESYFKNHDENKAKARERLKQARRLNPDSFKKSKLKSTYGLSEEQFLNMLNSQGNKCAICFKDVSGQVNTTDPKAFVDHNHKSGAVREILCLYCNSIIGFCREDREVLLRAIGYLKKFG